MPVSVVCSPHSSLASLGGKTTLFSDGVLELLLQERYPKVIGNFTEEKGNKKDSSLFKHIQAPSTGRHLIRNDSR